MLPAAANDVEWDESKDPTSDLAFFVDWLREALKFCTERAAVYQWHASRRQDLVERAWRANGLLVRQTIVWAKASGIISRCDYMWRHEPCFYGWREGHRPEPDRRPPSDQTTTWFSERENDHVHPTQKPAELFERPIAFHTREGEIVLEPFSGSGTQLAAAEKLGRRCFAMEISPAFVDVALERWQRVTGKQATLGPIGPTFAEVAVEREKDRLEQLKKKKRKGAKAVA